VSTLYGGAARRRPAPRVSLTRVPLEVDRRRCGRPLVCWGGAELCVRGWWVRVLRRNGGTPAPQSISERKQGARAGGGGGWPRSSRRWPQVLRVGSGHRDATVQGCGQRQAAECTARRSIVERRDESMSALGSRQHGSSETAAWAQGSLGAGWRHQVRFVRAERKDSSSLMCPSLSHPAPSSAAYCSSSSSLGDARYSLCPIA
jgi:hypothetical protein